MRAEGEGEGEGRWPKRRGSVFHAFRSTRGRIVSRGGFQGWMGEKSQAMGTIL